MAVKFLIDSASDVLPEECAREGITHLPLKVLFGAEEYSDSVTLTHAQFYEKLAADPNHPTTSQVTPAEFADAFAALVSQGHEVVAITISSALSGTYQSACIAAEEFQDQVFVVDSRTATMGERVLLRRGLELAAQGRSAAHIAAQLDEEKHRIRLYALVDTLEYLKRGGRISAATAVVGGLLNIKPLISVEEGQVRSVGKARGPKAANAALRDLVEKTRGIDPELPVSLVYSGPSDENLRKFLAEQGDLLEGIPAPEESGVGCVIGAHVGPGAVGIAYFERL